MEAAERRRRAHLNLVESSRRLWELDTAATVEADSGILLGAGRHPSPIANAAFRADDGADPAELIERARAFFDPRGRAFILWTRGDQPEDADLVGAAEAAGMGSVYEMPEMVCRQPVSEHPLTAGAELRPVASRGEAQDYWTVCASAYRSLDFPPDLFDAYDDYGGLSADGLAAFLAYLDGEPMSVAMTIVNNGVAGIYWVGSLEKARGKGLAWATTAAATNAGFEMGAQLASLQASPMGRSLYEAMGYETVYPYRLMLASEA